MFHRAARRPDHIHGLSWDDYRQLLEIRGDRSAPRIAYLDSEVEIMSPSRTHEAICAYRDALRSADNAH